MTRADLRELRERLQAERLELISDIEERQRQLDEEGPVISKSIKLADVEPPLVHKTTNNDNSPSEGELFGDAYAPPFTDEQMDIVAELLAMERSNVRDELDSRDAALRVEIAELKGQLAAVMAMVGGTNGMKTISSTRKRRGDHGGDRLLAPPSESP